MTLEEARKEFKAAVLAYRTAKTPKEIWEAADQVMQAVNEIDRAWWQRKLAK
ncbi:hypothetical protein [Gelria sp. Kuro-4]|uniref:hypothetical protein n=1 Tax=Gelria sp. Kuro-4 TaxID=2796927 RepID=UPI001BEE8C88|nr:hypothetical protein [Gelria sp. Kuro-4]BCV23249.1 hypothetical protein kuro4_00220 [Gelria sp. Kuro-4]